MVIEAFSPCRNNVNVAFGATPAGAVEELCRSATAAFLPLDLRAVTDSSEPFAACHSTHRLVIHELCGQRHQKRSAWTSTVD